jgi:hypothetical protein
MISAAGTDILLVKSERKRIQSPGSACGQGVKVQADNSRLVEFDRMQLNTMRQYIVNFLTNFHSKNNSRRYKIISLLFGMLFFWYYYQ